MITIREQLYNVEIRISYGVKYDDMQEQLYKDWGQVEELKDDNGRLFTKGSKCWIWTQRRYFPDILHEMVHCACQILDYHGVPVSFDNDECIAYIVGFLAKKFLEKNKGII